MPSLENPSRPRPRPASQSDRLYAPLAADAAAGASPGEGTTPWFSGTVDFTGYMRQALFALNEMGPGQRVLDIPAGMGQFTDALRAGGHTVTPADINKERPDYAFADMTRRLPFDDGAFDAAVCLEGIEHMADPLLLLGELIRVVRPGGRVILSTPNVQNYYSRLRFLFTGTFYQFNPATIRDLPPGAMEDRFHISPLTLQWLWYFATYFGARVIDVRGDRKKKKWLAPVYALIWLLGRPWGWSLFLRGRAADPAWRERNTAMHAAINSRPMLLSRTMIVVMEKK